MDEQREKNIKKMEDSIEMLDKQMKDSASKALKLDPNFGLLLVGASLHGGDFVGKFKHELVTFNFATAKYKYMGSRPTYPVIIMPIPYQFKFTTVAPELDPIAPRYDTEEVRTYTCNLVFDGARYNLALGFFQHDKTLLYWAEKA